MNLIDVTRQFPTEDHCLAFLENQRWPDGVIRCAVCGCSQVSRITRKTPGKNKRTRIYQCLEKTCKQQFSATSGTIYDGSHLPLVKWFAAISLMVDAKKGLSALQMQQHLGIGSYKTAWYLCHRIRKAMIEANPTPMSGTVEVDETYLGGTAIRKFRKTITVRPPKDTVLAIRERSYQGKVGRVRFFHIPDAKRDTIHPIIQANVAANVRRLITDQSSIYDQPVSQDLAKAHRRVNHSQEWIVPGSRIHTNTVESAFSLLKRGLIGSFHRVSVKHLHRYLTEFEYRFNARKASDRFGMTVREMVIAQPMQYKQLTSGE
jgi:ISXO2-like transposase domain/Transposase zinc-ribbon domain